MEGPSSKNSSFQTQPVDTGSLGSHLKSMLVLAGASVVICSGLYPLSLLFLGNLITPELATGSMIRNGEKVTGSRLIAQEFTQPHHFVSRPSAVGYQANGSGGSNLASSNPKLRDRVARDIAAIVLSENPRIVEEIDKWISQIKTPLEDWVKNNPVLASQWLDDNNDPINAWMERFPGTAKTFYERFSELNGHSLPKIAETKEGDKVTKTIVAITDQAEIRLAFFDQWLKANPDKSQLVDSLIPADRVTTSGSGLDPHITLANANSQLPGVLEAWNKRFPGNESKIKNTITDAIRNQTRSSLLAPEPVVNVLELNLRIEKELGKLK